METMPKHVELEARLIESMGQQDEYAAACAAAIENGYTHCVYGCNHSSATLCRSEAEAEDVRRSAHPTWSREKLWEGGSGDGIEILATPSW